MPLHDVMRGGTNERGGDVERDGVKEVLETFLGYSHGDGEDDGEGEDEVFVTTLWWCLLVALVICCIKKLDVIGRVLWFIDCTVHNGRLG